MVLQELIKLVCNKCYNEFILTNNKNNDKIYGTALKLTDNPIIKEKVFKIKGMTCQHCVANVTRAINAIEGVSSQVNLKKEEAHVVYDRDVDDQVIIAAVKQAGYDVI